MGHFARVCRNKTNNTRKQRINYLEETYSEEEESEPEEIQQITQINRVLPDKNDNNGIRLKINGKYQNFTNDTGSPVTIMPNNPKLYDTKDIKPLKKKIPRRKLKRNQIPGEDMVRYRVQRKDHKITITNYTKRRHYTTIRCKLAKTTANYNQQNLIGRTDQPIRKHLHKIQQTF